MNELLMQHRNRLNNHTISWLDVVMASMRPEIEERMRPMIESYEIPPEDGPE